MEIFRLGGAGRWTWALFVVVVASAMLAEPLLSTTPLFLRDLGMWQYPVLRDARVGEDATVNVLPYWSSSIGHGRPLAANTAYALFHPANLLYLVFPFDRAFNLFISLHVMVAGLGMLFLARRVGCCPAAAFVAAAAYMMGGYVMSCTAQYPMIAPVAWAPVVLAVGLAAAREPSSRHAAVLALVLALQLLGGQPDAAAMTVLVGVAWSCTVVGRRSSLGCLATWMVSTLWACALASPQLLPAYLHVKHSVRGFGLAPETILYWSFHPARIIEFLAYPAAGWLVQGAPDDVLIDGGKALFNSLYMGVSVIVLAAVGAVTVVAARGSRKRGHEIPPAVIVVTAVVGVVLAFGRYVPGVPSLINVTAAFVPFRYPVKFLLVTVLASSLLAAVGFEFVTRKVRVLYSAAIVVVVVLDLFFAHRQMTPVTAVAPARQPSTLARILEEAGRLGTAEPGQWRTYHHRLPESGWGPRLPRGEVVDADHYFSWQQKMLMPRTGPNHGIRHAFEPSIEMLDSREYFSLAVAMHRANLVTLARTLGDAGVLWMISPRPDLEKRSRGELVGITELGTNIGVPPGSAFLYRVRAFAPRVRLTRRFRNQSDATSDDVVSSSAIGGGPTPVILGCDPGIEVEDGAEPEGSVKILLDSGRRLEVEASCDRPSLLYVADVYAPGWTARVDNREVDVLRANVAFRAVPLTSGRHRIDFRYRPPGLLLGVIIAVAAGFGVVYCLWPRGRPASPVRIHESQIDQG